MIVISVETLRGNMGFVVNVELVRGLTRTPLYHNAIGPHMTNWPLHAVKMTITSLQAHLDGLVVDTPEEINGE